MDTILNLLGLDKMLLAPKNFLHERVYLRFPKGRSRVSINISQSASAVSVATGRQRERGRGDWMRQQPAETGREWGQFLSNGLL